MYSGVEQPVEPKPVTIKDISPIVNFASVLTEHQQHCTFTGVPKPQNKIGQIPDNQ
jgi:hypothetical protein